MKASSRKNISSGVHWEALIGYSRAVRIGNFVEVAGTVAVEDGEVVAPGDSYKQTVFILDKIEKSLLRAGAEMKDVVRTRIYVTNIKNWQEVGRAHGEYFNKIRPVTTMVEVSALVNPEYLVEIEASAIIE